MPFCECLLERREKRGLRLGRGLFRISICNFDTMTWKRYFEVMLLDYSYSNYFRMNVTLIELNVIDLDLAVVFL